MEEELHSTLLQFPLFGLMISCATGRFQIQVSNSIDQEGKWKEELERIFMVLE